MKRLVDRELLEPTAGPLPPPQRVAVSPHGMVSTAHDGATRAGVAVLERGGNAADAAAAAAFALGVCEPAASGLGGQTMALVHVAATRRTVALDGSSRAPHRAVPGLLKPAERRRGYRSATVPSTPATLGYLVEHYGRLDLPAILQPAIAMAKEGVRITPLQHGLTRREASSLRAGTAAPFFLRNGKRPWPVGSVLRQPVLARTLRRLARRGIRDFYTGRIARVIDADMRRNDGLIRLDDLARIPWPMERRPLSCSFEGMRVLTMPPPGAGRTLVEMLNILAEFPDALTDLDTPREAMLIAAVIRQAFRDRADRPRDPDYYEQVGEKRMLSRDHARSIARRIRKDLDRRSQSAAPPASAPRGRKPGELRGETTHLSVMDRDGNAVALTQSIERVYGSCSVTPELGFLYNDYVSAFEHDTIGHPYHLRPGGVPWASVAPTIVMRGRRAWLAIGSPGSERITPSILQVLLRLRRRTPWEAVDAPRLHCSIDGVVSLEASRMRSDIPAMLVNHGYEVRERSPYSFYLGCVQLVMRDRYGFTGVADPRRDGSAAGPRQ